MASTSLLGLALPTTGTTNWGTIVNDSITSLIDSAVAGTTTLSTDADVTLTTTVDAANQARQAVLLCTGARTVLRTITAPAQSKTYVVINATTGGFAVKIVGIGPTTGVLVPNGSVYLVAWNGSDFVVVNSVVYPLAISATTATSLTPDITLYNQFAYTALASALTINVPTGTPRDGDKLIFRILDNGTSRTITFTGGVSGGFRPIGTSLTASGSDFTFSTTISKLTYFGCIYNASAARWDVVALTTQA